MDDEGTTEEHAIPSPSPPQEDLRTATEKVNISSPNSRAKGNFEYENDTFRTWDCPIERYRDLGSPTQPVRAVKKGEMDNAKRWLTTKLARFGAPMPINTLDGKDSNIASPSTSRPAQETTDPPPLKRQRLEKNNGQNNDADEERHPAPYITSAFELLDGMAGAAASQKTDYGGNLSLNAIQPYVEEYQNVERRIHPPSSPEEQKRVEQKRKPGKNQQKEAIDIIDIIESDEDPIDLVQPIKPAHSTVAPDELANRFTAKSKAKRPLNGLDQREAVKSKSLTPNAMNGKRPRSSSADELAEDGHTSKAHPPKRTTFRPPGESQRGHINPVRLGVNASQGSRKSTSKSKITEQPLNKAKHIITSTGLKINHAVSGDHRYPSPIDETYLPCFLRVHEVSSILNPTGEQGNILSQVAYLTVNLAKVGEIRFPRERTHSIISISRSLEPSISAAPKLHIEFESQKDVQSFLNWVDVPRDPPCGLKQTAVPDEQLKKELDHLFGLARLGYVITDAGAQRPNLSDADDVRLAEHNLEKRRQQQQKPTALQTFTSHDTPRARPRIKDNMQTPMSQQPVELIGDSESPQSPAVRQTRAKRKPPSPSPPPPDLWTEKNPSWADQWRDSLIYPPTGKSRATVDKVDIPRLDEGQFLNDNLIIFYLRYLQHELERQRPDLAGRIYFHNTFFYEKLKPTKTSGGINYDSVKAWTTKVDLFKKDFIVVPINEFSHWYIAIIYNAPKLDPTARKSPAVDSIVPHTEDSASRSNHVAGEQSTEPMAKSLANTAGEVTNGIGHMSLESSGSDPIVVADGLPDISINAKDLGLSDEQVGESLPASGTEPKKATKKGNTGGKKHSPDEPRIITLDSLGSGHSPACRNLKDYLVKELRDKKAVEMADPGSLTMTAKGIPTQSNHCDCGLYLLGYVVQFLRDPDSFIRTLLLHENIEWDIDAPALRNEIRTLLFKLQNEQKAREDERIKAKREAALAKRKRSSQPRSSEGINEAPASTQMTPIRADPSPKSPVRLSTERSLVNSPAPVMLARESIEGGEITSSAATAPKEADVTILDEHQSKTPDRPVASCNISDRSSSAVTELEMETPRAMPSSNSVKRRPPREAVPQVAEDIITESDIERDMLPPLPETPVRTSVEESRSPPLDGSGLPGKSSENASSNFAVVIPSRERFEKQKQEAARRSAHKSPKETARESPYFPSRFAGLKKDETVRSATAKRSKPPEIVNVDDDSD